MELGSLTNNFILDGQDNNSVSENVQELSTQIARPSVDAIGEFKVITSQYSADTGRSAGGVISVTTKLVQTSFMASRMNTCEIVCSMQTTSFRIDWEGENHSVFRINLAVISVDLSFANARFFFFDYEGTRIRLGCAENRYGSLAVEKAGTFLRILVRRFSSAVKSTNLKYGWDTVRTIRSSGSTL